MINLNRIILDGLRLSLLSSAILMASFLINPRILLQDYPKDVQARVAPKTTSEKRLGLIMGIPFLLGLLLIPFFSTMARNTEMGENSTFIALFINAFGVAFVFNLVDWLLLDWLLFCTITPKFLVIPGTEGAAGYQDYGYHVRGFMIGTVLSVMAGLVIAGIVFFIG